MPDSFQLLACSLVVLALGHHVQVAGDAANGLLEAAAALFDQPLDYIYVRNWRSPPLILRRRVLPRCATLQTHY